MITTTQIPRSAIQVEHDTHAALRLITCGSVDDGKSTLIGRLLLDSRAVMKDQLAHVSEGGEADLALFTDGLIAEREQGITIDVAYRYFTSPKRKFIIGDAPGHEQYTRNMVTAASTADVAVVLVDATKLKWQEAGDLALLSQTRRHTLLTHLLRVPNIIFAVNKLDAFDHEPDTASANNAPEQAFQKIKAALQKFAIEADIEVSAIIPISALKGYNVVHDKKVWCGYTGPSLLHVLEQLPVTSAEVKLPFTLSVQWVEKSASSNNTEQGRRIFWGRVGTGLTKKGQKIKILPSGQLATITQVLNHVRTPQEWVRAGHGCGVILEREVDVSRGDWLLASHDHQSDIKPTRTIKATVAWMDEEPLISGRIYQMMHGRRWVKCKVTRIVHNLDINTLKEHDATELKVNAIGHIELALQEAVPAQSFTQSRFLGSAILVDTTSNKTSGALLFHT